MQAVKAWRGRQSGVKSSPDGGYLGLVGEPAPCVLQVRAVRMPGGGLSAEKGGLSNVMKTTAAKNHLARAAPRCRPNGKWSTVDMRFGRASKISV